ncbi:hypothetical protein AGMMS50255_1300 [Spirochaetia bacterium]|nr:hypothetical protein AGMMS50255_1300 [Spirochaetia bacterium]
MKKLRFFGLPVIAALAAMLAAGLTFTGCDTGGGDTTTAGGGIPSELLGLWTGTYSGSTTTAEFKSDNTLAITLGSSPASTYKVNGVSGGTVSIESSGANTTDGTFNYSISSNTMTVSAKTGTGNAMYANTYTKASSSGGITYTATANGTSDTADSTAISFTFSAAVSELAASDITVTNGTGSATKGALSGSGTSYSLPITVTTEGNVTVSISKSGIESGTKTVAVYKAGGSSGITYTATANGTSGSVNSTAISFTFSASVTGLTASDITVTNGTGSATKGALSGSGTSWSLALASVTTEGNVTVSITKTGIESAGKTVAVYKAPSDIIPAEFVGFWEGVKTGSPSTYVSLTINGDGTFSGAFMGGNDDTLSGTCSVSGSTITFATGPDGRSATLTESTLTLIWSGMGTTALTRNDTPYDSGLNWTKVTESHFGDDYYSDIKSIAFGNGKFVAGGGRGKIATSTDGINWTLETSPFGTAITNNAIVAYGDGIFLAGYNKTDGIWTSTDGSNWTNVAANSPFSTFDSIDCIAFGNNTWVLVSGNATSCSTDGGITWSALGFPDFSIKSIVYGDGKFVAVGNRGKIVTSINGSTWTLVKDDIFDDGYTSLDSVVYGNGKFVAVGKNGTATSTNGSTWTLTADNKFSAFNSIKGIAYGNSQYVVAGQFLDYLAVSPDGSDWALETNGVDNSGTDSLNGIVYGNDKFVAVGDKGTIIYSH